MRPSDHFPAHLTPRTHAQLAMYCWQVTKPRLSRSSLSSCNTSQQRFERSLYKGRSKALRLNVILRQLFLLSVKYDCVFEPHWISTHDNVAADALSRGDIPRFQEYVYEHFGGDISLCRIAESAAQ